MGKNGHECTDQCKSWHEKNPPRGMKPNSVPAGDERHLSEEMKQRKKK